MADDWLAAFMMNPILFNPRLIIYRAALGSAAPDIHDIGILASADPVALNQACIDLVGQAQGNRSLLDRIDRQNGIHTLEHAEEIGLGSRSYTLVDIGG